MKNKWIKRFFPLFVFLLLAPWPLAYAYTYISDAATPGTVQVSVPDSSAAPTWTVFGGAIGGVNTPGDIFYLDATGNTVDVQATLYITNAQELIRAYRYLILKVGVYVESDTDTWEGAANADTFITLQDAQLTFTLTGDAKYKVTIDSGSFYGRDTNFAGGSVSPNFYLRVD